MPVSFWQVSYKIGFIFTVLLLAFGLSLFLSRMIRRYSEINPSLRPISSVIRFFMKLLLYLVASLIILDNLGVQIGSLVASLGISGLAVSLALVDVLKDIFTGIYVLAEKTVRVGDYVILASGEEGEVTEIGWRSVKLKKKSGEMVIIPNFKFYQSSLTVKR